MTPSKKGAGASARHVAPADRGPLLPQDGNRWAATELRGIVARMDLVVEAHEGGELTDRELRGCMQLDGASIEGLARFLEHPVAPRRQRGHRG